MTRRTFSENQNRFVAVLRRICERWEAARSRGDLALAGRLTARHVRLQHEYYSRVDPNRA